MAIYIIKVTTNKEDRALEMISDRARKKQLAVQAVVRPHGLKGYLILEAEAAGQTNRAKEITKHLGNLENTYFISTIKQ